MYESFFALTRRPFTAAAATEAYFPARATEAARQTLARAIDRAEGVGVLIGGSGTGKTLVCQLLRQQFQKGFAVALLGKGRLDSPRSLLQAVLYELGLPCRGMDEGDLRLSLIDFLTNPALSGAGLVLLVDEAHTLAARALEEIRLITNVTIDGQARVRLVLAGGQLLEERLSSPKLESFSQRIAARTYLEPLDRGETASYIAAQLRFAGADVSSVFSAGAMDSAYRAADGIPRLINQVCDHALVLAFSNGVRRVEERDIEEAWADLQQLPTPWTETASTDTKEDVIQFGHLDDELEDVPAGRSGLRLASELDDVEFEPASQLEQIEQQLASIDVAYDATPRASAGSNSASTHDPFSEAFAEEEVVVERFGTEHAAVWEQMPHVYSTEGRLLSSMLAPFVQTIKPHQISVLTGDTAGQSAQRGGTASLARQTETSSIDEYDSVASTNDFEWQAPRQRPMIVVESDPVAPQSVPTAPRAMRREYSQLFANLRRES